MNTDTVAIDRLHAELATVRAEVVERDEALVGMQRAYEQCASERSITEEELRRVSERCESLTDELEDVREALRDVVNLWRMPGSNAAFTEAIDRAAGFAFGGVDDAGDDFDSDED